MGIFDRILIITGKYGLKNFKVNRKVTNSSLLFKKFSFQKFFLQNFQNFTDTEKNDEENYARTSTRNLFHKLNISSSVTSVPIDISNENSNNMSSEHIESSESSILTESAKKQSTLELDDKSEFKEVNLEGGGGKGVAYIGALQELAKRGLLKGVECFSGASVGAMTALFMALGADLNRMQEIALAPNSFLNDMPTYKEWLEKESLALHERLSNETGIDAFEERTGASFSDSVVLTPFQIAKAFYQQGGWATGDELHKFIGDLCEEFINKAAEKVGPADSQAHKDFLTIFKDIRNPTFREIAEAREKFPQAGLYNVSMAITGPNGEYIQADKDNSEYADKGVADIARISAALPVVFSSVSGYRDGGIVKNIGAISNAGKNLSPGERLILGFDREPKGILRSFMSNITGPAGGFFTQYALGVNHHELAVKNLDEAKSGQLGIYIPIQHGSVTTIDIPPTPEKAKEAIEAGRDSMCKALDKLERMAKRSETEENDNRVNDQGNDNSPGMR